MAKYTGSMLIGSIQGSIGGYTFKKSHQGLIVHPKQRRIVSQSEEQLFSRGVMNELRQSWSTLTTQARASWNSLALQLQKSRQANGQYPLRGYELFIEYNFLRHYFGDGLTSSAPNAFIRSAPNGITTPNGRLATTPFARVNDIEFEPNTNQLCIVYIRLSQRAKQRSTFCPWRRVKTFYHFNGSQIITSDYSALLPPPRLGQLYQYKFRYQSGTAFPNEYTDIERTVVI